MSHRHTGEASAALLYGLVAVGGGMMWLGGAGLLMTLDPAGHHAAGWACVLGGALGLLAVTLLVVSLLRSPRIVVHDPSGTRWSVRATPVPLRIADSAGLTDGSHGAVLAAQVVRAATRHDRASRATTTQAVVLLRQILALAARTPTGRRIPAADAEWRPLRAAVVDFALRTSDHPPQPVTPTTPVEPQRFATPW